VFGGEEDHRRAGRVGALDRRQPTSVVELLDYEPCSARSSGLVDGSFVPGVVHRLRV
jgi:hypothetical protein